MSKKNRAVILQKGGVTIEEVPYPKFEIDEKGKKRECHHGVILKTIATNICGSDLHMYRGRTSAKPGLRMGHEITGEIAEIGRDVENFKVGDWVSVPFNVACGRCQNCIERKTNICINTNPDHPGAAYGYADMGYWPGGQAEYVLIPYADFNLLKLPKDVSRDKFLDMAFLSDILPTAYFGAKAAKVNTGSNVLIAGVGPVGLCSIACCKLLGAGHIFVSDYEVPRLEIAKKMGAIAIDLNKQKIEEVIQQTLGIPYVDSSIDCTGFECSGHHGQNRHTSEDEPESLNALFQATKFGGGVGILGIYLPEDPGAVAEAKKGYYKLKFSEAWNKYQVILGGQCPVMKYNRRLLNAILAGNLEVSKYINTTIISLDQAPQAYKDHNEGAPRKYVIDPHGMLASFPHSK